MDNPTREISMLDIVSPEEKKLLVHDFNDTAAGYPKNNTIHELVVQQVDKTPNQVVLVGKDAGWKGRKIEGKKENVLLTYRELNEKSFRLAGLLKEKGVKRETMAGLMVERSPEMIAALLAITKSGGAILPIDPGYPADRILTMLNDSGSTLLLTQSNLLQPFPITSLNNMKYSGKKELVVTTRQKQIMLTTFFFSAGQKK